MSEQTYDLTGLTCAACVSAVDAAIRKVPGVASVQVNLAVRQAQVEVADAEAEAEGVRVAILSAVSGAGYGATLRDAKAGADPLLQEAEAARRRLQEVTVARRRVSLAGVFCLPLLILALGPLVGIELPPWTRWLQGALATVVLLSGASIFRAAARRALHLGASMDTLVALGTLTAWSASAYALVTEQGNLHFGPAGMIVTLVLFGRFLESRAQGQTGAALRGLLDLVPPTARVLDEAGAARQVPLAEVAVGDVLRVLPGEAVPTDGVVLVGSSAVSEALITGESMPVTRGPGDPVVGGSVNGPAPLVIRADRVGGDTRLAQIVRLVARAQGSKTDAERLADRASAVFVPVILAVALAAGAAWYLSGAGLERAALAAVAVLVVACPCALGLATPTAIVVAVGRAAKDGVLIREARSLEALARVTHVVFDKTGTLTEGRFVVEAVEGPAPAEQVLALAGALEAQSEHPLAAGIVAEREARNLPSLPASEVELAVGGGISGKVAGQVVRAGRPAWLAEQGIDVSDLGAVPSGATRVAVSRGDALLGAIDLRDAPRTTAREAVSRVRGLGLTAVLLTGDRRETAERVAAELGLDVVCAEVPPDGKLAEVERLHAEGAEVAMVGDGLNDAPALAAARVGIAMGQGTDVAKQAAALTLLRDDPRAVAAAIALSRRTLRTIRQNLAWAFGYNIVTVPLAAAGVLPPVVAAGAMALSSVIVVTNSLRLRGARELSEVADVDADRPSPSVEAKRADAENTRSGP